MIVGLWKTWKCLRWLCPEGCPILWARWEEMSLTFVLSPSPLSFHHSRFFCDPAAGPGHGQ